MKLFILLILVSFNASAFIKFEVRWTEAFRKELVLGCANFDSTCLSLCQQNNSCVIQESSCRDCIGTGLRMSRIIGEIGKGIRSDNRVVSVNRLLDLVHEGNFVTLVPNDVYNVIDGVNSLSALKKFEALCPPKSVKQIMFFSVDPDSRKIAKPEFVVCEVRGWPTVYGLTEDMPIVIEEGSQFTPF